MRLKFVTMRSVSSETLLIEVTRMLQGCELVYIPTKGDSMRPFIRGEKDMVGVKKPSGEYCPGMIVLARTLDHRVVLHRIVAVGKEYLDLMGDGNLLGRERCRRSDVVAVAIYIIKGEDGRKRYLYTDRRMQKWKIWYWLRPFRRWLLRLV